MSGEGRYEQRLFALPPDATEIVLVRHGASVSPAPGALFPMRDGHGDPELSAAGEEQARRVGERLAGDPPAALFHTGLRRTEQTAAAIGAPTGLRAREIRELREVRLGDWEAASSGSGCPTGTSWRCACSSRSAGT